MKREYKKPIIATYSVDKDISLILMSENTIPVDPTPSAAQSEPEALEQSSSFEDNPFDENNLK